METPARAPQSASASWFVLAGVIAIAAVCLIVPSAAAHPPSAVSLSYNDLNRELNVTITHQVADAKTHYVKEVLVRVSGQDIATMAYTTQPLASPFTYTYPLDARPGETIEATAVCSIAGSAKGTLIVPGPAGSSPAETGGMQPTQKSPVAGLVPVVAIALLPAWGKVR
jgi:hypothetical protein